MQVDVWEIKNKGDNNNYSERKNVNDLYSTAKSILRDISLNENGKIVYDNINEWKNCRTVDFETCYHLSGVLVWNMFYIYPSRTNHILAFAGVKDKVALLKEKFEHIPKLIVSVNVSEKEWSDIFQNSAGLEKTLKILEEQAV